MTNQQQNLRDFPSLYSLNPKTATIVDAKKCIEAGCASDEIDDNGEWGAVAYFAIHSDNVPLIRYLLRMGKPKKLSSYKNNTPLLSVVKNHVIFETLIRFGVDVNETDDDGRTALWLLTSDVTADEFIRHLLRHGADIDKEDKYGFTPLENAIKADRLFIPRTTAWSPEYKCPITDLLLEHGAVVRKKTLDVLAGQHYDRFFHAKCKALLHYTDINETDIKPVYEHCPEKHKQGKSSDWHGMTNPFRELAYNAYDEERNVTVEDIKKALDEDGNPNETFYFGGAILSCANAIIASTGNPETVAYLLNRCESLKLISSWDQEGLYSKLLGEIRNPEIVDMVADYAPYLLEKTPGIANNTLAEAAYNLSPENIRHLIRLGANINPWFEPAPDYVDEDTYNDVRSALEDAVQCNENPDVVSTLLKAGCDVERDEVLTCLEWAVFPVKKAELLLATGQFTVDELLTSVKSNQREGIDISVYETYRQTETNVEDIRTDVLDSIMIINALKSGKSRQIVPFLKKALKGDMNHRNSNWETPLMIAVSAHIDNSKTVLKLLEAGADPTLKNNDGKTVYEIDMDPKTKECLTQFKQEKQL
ncbi:MAG: hypothetical protein J5781_04315 [Clostridia bacterium]|nr:hypothetical protein [Clostridia bacterium]